MHAKFLYALAAPALISAAALPQNDPVNWDDSSEDIVGGVAASATDAPFIVSLQRSGSHICGGTLVNANTVVTAAHCTVNQVASNLKVRAGSINRSSGGVLVQVASIKYHPNYVAGTYNNDVAVWKLSTSIPEGNGVTYGTLAAAGTDPAAGTTLTVAGWGVTSSGSSSSPTALRKVDVPVVSRATCNSNYGSGSITSAMFCAGLTQGGKDSCQGDSGGPIYTSSKVVVGAVSWGNGCAAAGYPGVYANIGALQTWLSANV